MSSLPCLTVLYGTLGKKQIRRCAQRHSEPKAKNPNQRGLRFFLPSIIRMTTVCRYARMTISNIQLGYLHLAARREDGSQLYHHSSGARGNLQGTLC